MTQRRHCEERRDEAIQFIQNPAQPTKPWTAAPFGLAVTTPTLDRHGLRPRDDTAPSLRGAVGDAAIQFLRHCEERRDEAIQTPLQQNVFGKTSGSPRPARRQTTFHICLAVVKVVNYNF